MTVWSDKDMISRFKSTGILNDVVSIPDEIRGKEHGNDRAGQNRRFRHTIRLPGLRLIIAETRAACSLLYPVKSVFSATACCFSTIRAISHIKGST